MHTYRATSEIAMGGRARRCSLGEGSAPLSFGAVLERWRDDADFRSFFADVLADAEFEAFEWETPPVTRATLRRRFEYVLLDAPFLLEQTDPEPFRSHFTDEGDGVVAFENLGRDALLVVPSPRGSHAAYGHLAAFVRGGRSSQVDALWRRVAEEVTARLSDRPLWLSTAGGGVAWLHVRLDARPKYYGYRPYAEEGGA